MCKKKENKKRAGKPAFFSKPMKRINVTLDEETIKFYTEQGKGNLSEGIRKHWRGPTKRAIDPPSAPSLPSTGTYSRPMPEIVSTNSAGN